MTYKNIILTTKAGIATLTINRPGQLNALNKATIEEIDHALTALAGDVKGLLITGAGDKAFIAGADIKELAGLSPAQAKELSQYGQRVFARLEKSALPTIALINGFALGGGLELAMACHLRLASDNARLGQPEVNLGLIPGYGGTQRLPRLVGEAHALELLLTGDMISAQRAAELGLVNRVYPREELYEAGVQLMQKILSKGPLAVRYCLEAVQQGRATTVDNGMEIESSLFGMAFSTGDMKEGTRAFIEKRPAKFSGK